MIPTSTATLGTNRPMSSALEIEWDGSHERFMWCTACRHVTGKRVAHRVATPPTGTPVLPVHRPSPLQGDQDDELLTHWTRVESQLDGTKIPKFTLSSGHLPFSNDSRTLPSPNIRRTRENEIREKRAQFNSNKVTEYNGKDKVSRNRLYTSCGNKKKT